MQAQQSLFQSAFKDPNQRTAHGVKKSIPFLNLWAPSADVQKLQAAQKRDLNTEKMASATSFYDFKPLDSSSPLHPFLHPWNPIQARNWSGMTLLFTHAHHQLLTVSFWQRTEKGNAVPLETYKGKVVLIVNTASKCGFTPQYQGLENLYKKINETHPDQFIILGFPCNQFGGQEPVRLFPSPLCLFMGVPPTPPSSLRSHVL
jgi:glutathione peroxidase